MKLKCDELEKENSTLRHQRDMLQEFHQKQKTKADNLDMQRKSLQASLAHLTESEVGEGNILLNPCFILINVNV